MAEGDNHVYRDFKYRVMQGHHDLDSDTIKCALVAAYTLDEVGDAVWADVSTKEIVDTSYTAQTLAGLAVTGTGTGTGTANKGKWDANDVVYSSLTGTNPSHAILYNDTPTAPADPLIAAIELTTATNGGNYTIQWNANGIIRIS